MSLAFPMPPILIDSLKEKLARRHWNIESLPAKCTINAIQCVIVDNLQAVDLQCKIYNHEESINNRRK